MLEGLVLQYWVNDSVLGMELMQRDLKLSERLISWMETHTPVNGSLKEELKEALRVESSDVTKFDYHLDLLTGAGFINREASVTGSTYYKLTWQGHDLGAQLRAQQAR